MQDQVGARSPIYSTRSSSLLPHYKNTQAPYQVHQMTAKAVNEYVEAISEPLRSDSRYARFVFQSWFGAYGFDQLSKIGNCLVLFAIQNCESEGPMGESTRGKVICHADDHVQSHGKRPLKPCQVG